jgi:hypothetical protein
MSSTSQESPTLKRLRIDRTWVVLMPHGVHQFEGNKVDGVAMVASRKMELLVLEADKKDEGPNVTKAFGG